MKSPIIKTTLIMRALIRNEHVCSNVRNVPKLKIISKIDLK